MSVASVNFVSAFQQALGEGGDMFFSMQDYDKDMQTIIDTIKAQGYWAGVRLRYFFDMQKLDEGVIELLSVQERTFG